MPLPVEDRQFWKDRIEKAQKSGNLHKCVYDTDLVKWKRIQEAHREILIKFIPSGSKVLDAGCGYGALVEILPQRTIHYWGVDLSPEFIELAHRLHPRFNFVAANLRDLPFLDNQFDIAVVRSVDGMIKEHVGVHAWREMEKELLRVARQVLIFGFSEPEAYVLLENSEEPSIASLNTIALEGAFLIYRLGHGSIVEIHDLYVPEESRRKGVASALFKRLAEVCSGQTVFAFTRGNNEAAKSFYKRQGFTPTNLPGFYRGSLGIIYYRELA